MRPAVPELIFQITATGISIPSLEGRLFCSGRDPIREARSWFALELPFLRQADEVVVLGLGAGFHIQEILQSADHPSRLWVVEKNQALRDLWKKQEKQNKQNKQNESGSGSYDTYVHILPLDFLSSEADLSQKLYQDALILEFRPAWADQEELYQTFSKALRGSSVKEVVSRLSVQDQTREAKIWRALRELVR